MFGIFEKNKNYADFLRTINALKSHDKGYVSDIFRSPQGEGVAAGRDSMFIRLAGCHRHCAFCDTHYESGKLMTMNDIDDVFYEQASPDAFVFTGGEPLLQQEFIVGIINHYSEKPFGYKCAFDFETTGEIKISADLAAALRQVSYNERSSFFTISPKRVLTGYEYTHILRQLSEWKTNATRNKMTLVLKNLISDDCDMIEMAKENCKMLNRACINHDNDTNCELIPPNVRYLVSPITEFNSEVYINTANTVANDTFHYSGSQTGFAFLSDTTKSMKTVDQEKTAKNVDTAMLFIRRFNIKPECRLSLQTHRMIGWK